MGVLVANEPTRVKSQHRFRSAFSVTFRQFCQISSIHGIKYFHDKETHYVGKTIWFIVTISMFFCANAMIYMFYEEFASNPIRMKLESDHTPLTNLIFPAVTICPPTMYNYPEMRKIFRNLTLPENVTIHSAIDNLNELYVLVGKLMSFNETKLNFLQKTVDLNNFTTLSFIHFIRWKCADLLYRCRFQSKIVKCHTIFTTSTTHAGFCCSFNMDQFGLKFSNFSALKFGPEGGLSVILKNTKAGNLGNDPVVSSELELYVHENDAFPHKTMTSNSIRMNREIFAMIRPTEILCSQSFKYLAVQDRQCLLPHEHDMRFFRVYNSDNCEYECRTMSTFDACGCVPFFLVNNFSQAKPCDFEKLSCLTKTYTHIESKVKQNRTISKTSSCYCPTSCESIEYDVKLTQARLQNAIESFDPFYHGIQNNYTVLHVYMHSQVYRRLRRDTLSDIIILIGNLGSSFSLFVGMSVVSLVEIAYFFTLVLWQNYAREA